jgi:rhodanese-related sulfurtransferase
MLATLFKIRSRDLSLILFTFILSACSGNRETNPAPEIKPAEPVVIGNETSLFLKDLEENGDYVNSREFPSLIKASVVFENLDGNMHVIDIRAPESYKTGHIEGAVNKKFEDLPMYFETGIKPFSYDKIILVSEDGQVASYTAALLRLMGYGNVFALRWGMSSWNRTFAEKGWLKAVSGKFENKLDTQVIEMPAAWGMPELKTGMSTGEEIGKARFREVFSEGSGDVMIAAEEVFADPSRYYIINYERKDKYEDGHIPGAIRYKPDAMLGIVSEMATLPSDKEIVVYCGTGHNSGFVTAYLRLFGYKAKTLSYGNNGFMYDKMVTQKDALSWLPFTASEVHDYPVVK